MIALAAKPRTALVAERGPRLERLSSALTIIPAPADGMSVDRNTRVGLPEADV